MTIARDIDRHGAGHQPVATLVRSVPVRLVEVSRGGCRLECASRLESGTSGQLAVELQGLMRIDDVRVARCQQRMGAGPVFQLGAELLQTRRLGRRTVRMAVRKIISNERGVDHVRFASPAPMPLETPAGEVREQGKGRAPPRGS